MKNPDKRRKSVMRVAVALLLPVFLLTGPMAPLSFAQPAAQGTTSPREPQEKPAAQEPQAQPVTAADVGRVLLHGPICALAAALGFAVLVASFGTTWRSYKALIDEECVQPFKHR